MTVRATPIVALDTPDLASALRVVDELADLCAFYKVGNELFTAGGPKAVEAVRARGADVFLDLKFHDIPNTVAGGVRRAAAMGARLVTVHASGGAAMLSAAVDAAGVGCGVLAVTVLTSLDSGELAAVYGEADPEPAAIVLRLGRLAWGTGVHGLVCSGQEAAILRRELGAGPALLVPGVRLPGAGVNDQARVVTPGQAAAAGATYVVLGRTVTAAADVRAAMKAALADLR